MKIPYYFFLLLLYPFTVVSQNSNKDLTLFDKGNALYDLAQKQLNLNQQIALLDSNSIEGKLKINLLQDQKESILEFSLQYFEELITKYPQSNLAFLALKKVALIYEEQNDIDLALDSYKEILAYKSPISRKKLSEDTRILHSIYKNEACKKLVEIYLEQKDFKNALKYVKLTKEYPFQHFCGNAHAADEIQIATLYTKCYIGLDNKEAALAHSLPQLFHNGMASNAKLVELTVNFLKANYDKEKLITALDTAIEQSYSVMVKSNGEHWDKYYIKYMDVEIQIPTFDLCFYQLEKQVEQNTCVKKSIQESYFYTLLSNK